MLILYLSLREGQKYNVVIIAKRIHLFPYRTQKLSSLAAMVLGGQPPGRVARSHVIFFYYKNTFKVIFHLIRYFFS